MKERQPAEDGFEWHDLDAYEPRRLEVLTGGPRDGYPLVYHGGTPSGATTFRLLADEAARRGMRTILYSRPGYGRSTTALGRTVAQAATDTAVILEHLGHDEFVTIGWSGGGPHALACAALLDTCKGAGVIAGVAPRDAGGLDWFAGMANENLQEFSLAATGGPDFDAFLSTVADATSHIAGPSEIAGALGDLVTEKDSLAIAGTSVGDYLYGSFTEAFINGTTGWRDDDLAMLTDWGLDVGGIGVPVKIWHGSDDKMVPVSHGRWLAEHIPGARLEVTEGDGHISIVPAAVPDLLDFLAAAAGLNAPAGKE